MKKLCVLLDPNKDKVDNVAEACLRFGNSDKVEYWVGCTTSPLSRIRACLSRIRSLEPKYLYPSKLSHFFAFSLCDRLAVPLLLNSRNTTVRIESRIGSLLCRFLRRSERMAYLVTNPDSSVGRRTRAKEIEENMIVDNIRRFFSTPSKAGTIYIEAGSGSVNPVSAATVRDVREMLDSMGKYKLIVGGGVREPAQASALFRSGADRVVVGTALELDSVPAIIDRMREFASCF